MIRKVAAAKPLRLSSKNWFGKASAGLILGFFLALALSGILGKFVFGGVGQYSVFHQLSMWSIAPTFVVILSTCFLFQNGPKAWLWLGLINAGLWSVLFLSS